jgi:hypothetical protein
MSTSFEAAYLGQQIVQNFQGLRRDMRRNALDYPTRITAGQSVSDVATIMRADAAAYLDRLSWVKSIYDDAAHGQAILIAGLAAQGIDVNDMLAIYTELSTAATAQRSATIASADDVTSVSAALLASVAVNLILW